MYGSHQEFKGRISGFTMGTGSTLALLPAENATGNFVKVVQRLPVRIDLMDYDPDKAPLFIGLSVTPYVHINEAADRARRRQVPAAVCAGADGQRADRATCRRRTRRASRRRRSERRRDRHSPGAARRSVRGWSPRRS